MKRTPKSGLQQRYSERGAVLIVAVLCTTLLATACAFAVNIGRNVVVNRSLQSVADSGALDAARYLNVGGTCSAQASTITNAAQPVASDPTITPTVTAVPGTMSGTTFEPDGSPCNAVETVASESLGNLFVRGNESLSRTAVAALVPNAGIEIGTFLANLSTSQSTVLNTLLGNLSGHSTPSTISITAVGYDGLASAGITIQQLISANSSVLTTSNILTTSFTDAQWATFISNAVTASTGSSNSWLTGLATTLGGTIHTTSANLCQLVTLSSCGGSISVGDLSATINVLQTLQAEAELAENGSAIALNTLINLGTLTSVLNPLISIQAGSPSISISAIQKPVVAYGPVGTTATNSQVTATVNIPTELAVAGIPLVSLPIVIPIGVAQGTATLSSIECTDDALTQAQIGVVTTTASNSITVNGAAVTSLKANGANQTNTYAASVVPPTATTIANGTNPVSAGSYGIGTVSFGSGLLAGLTTVTAAVLNDVFGLLFGSLNTLLGPALQTLGISLAGADVADLSTNCGVASLVK